MASTAVHLATVPGPARPRATPPDRPPARPPAMIGVVSGLAIAAHQALDRLYEPPDARLAAILGASAAIALGLTTLRPIGRGTIARWVAMVAVCVVLPAGLDRLLVAAEARSPHLGVFARVVAPVVDRALYPAGADGGVLRVNHPDGLVSILPSVEKLGIRPMAELWTLWLVLLVGLDRRRLLDAALAGGVGMIVLAFVRFGGCVFLYLETDHILTEAAGHGSLSIFGGPAVGTLTAVGAGLMLDAIRRRLTRGLPFVTPWTPTIGSIARAGVGLAGLGLCSGFAATFTPPGPLKAGRILIDDRFCGVWEPTARLLDADWYGDFSTYSFSSLAEWLGHRYRVDVNTKADYTDVLLSGYDILILKTPVQPIAEAERAAIDRFVRAGGGLLLVGDHTNLLGMGTHLNSLCDRYGLRFRYDSVSDATTGGFVDYYGPAVGRSVGAIHVDHLQFMTSCSMELDARAEAIVVAPSCRRDPHDYAASSFFGRIGPHPEMAHGPCILAATAEAGRGRIAAFTDSTVWSSFAIFQHDREKLAGDLVAMLNRGRSPWTIPVRAIAVVGAMAMAVVGARRARSGMTFAAVLGGLAGIAGGVHAADRVHAVAYDPGPARSPSHEVSFLWQGGACGFPPVLGSIDGLAVDRAFDTLLVSFQRLGLIPRVAYEYDEIIGPDTRAVVVIAPVVRPPAATLAKVEAFVRSGGSLVVIDDGRLGGTGSAPDYMRRFGINLKYTRVADAQGVETVRSALDGIDDITHPRAPDTFIGHRAIGGGHVVYMRDAIQFSREGMGHCFNRPGRVARSRYETIFAVVRDVLGIDVGDRRYYGIIE